MMWHNCSSIWHRKVESSEKTLFLSSILTVCICGMWNISAGDEIALFNSFQHKWIIYFKTIVTNESALIHSLVVDSYKHYLVMLNYKHYDAVQSPINLLIHKPVPKLSIRAEKSKRVSAQKHNRGMGEDDEALH